MKRLTRIRNFSAVLGAGLLIATASGSAFARHTSGAVDQPRHEVHQQSTPAPVGQSSGEVEFQGVVEAMTSDTWIVGGHTVATTAATEIKAGLSTGRLAKVHAIRQADGSLWAREVEPSHEVKPSENSDQGNVNSNDNGNGRHDDGNDKNNSNAVRDNVNNNEDKSHVNTSSGNGNIQDNNGNDDKGSNNVQGNKHNSNHNGNDDHGDRSHGSGH